MWTAVRPFFLEADDRPHGLPSFTVPFLKMLDSEDFERVHVLLFVPVAKGQRRPQIKFPSRYSGKVVVHPFYYRRYRDLLRLFVPAVFKSLGLIRRDGIDVIFGHGPLGSIGGVASLLSGVPNVRRVYGISPKLLSLSKAKMLVRAPLEFLTFTLPAEALVVTNDGSGGDVLYRKLNRGGTRVKNFFFEFNGVHKDIEKRMKKPTTVDGLPESYLAYVARFEPIKGHLRLIEALSLLKERGLSVPTIMVGQVFDDAYFAQVRQKIYERGLGEDVTIITGLPWDETMYVLAHAIVSCVLYDSNVLCNVTLESLSLGVPTIALNVGGTLDAIPDNVLVKLPENSSEQYELIASAIERLLLDEQLRAKLRREAKRFATENLRSWDERADWELGLVKEAARKHRLTKSE